MTRKFSKQQQDTETIEQKESDFQTTKKLGPRCFYQHQENNFHPDVECDMSLFLGKGHGGTPYYTPRRSNVNKLKTMNQALAAHHRLFFMVGWEKNTRIKGQDSVSFHLKL